MNKLMTWTKMLGPYTLGDVTFLKDFGPWKCGDFVTMLTVDVVEGIMTSVDSKNDVIRQCRFVLCSS